MNTPAAFKQPLRNYPVYRPVTLGFAILTSCPPNTKRFVYSGEFSVPKVSMFLIFFIDMIFVNMIIYFLFLI